MPYLVPNPEGFRKLRSRLGNPTNDSLARRMDIDPATLHRVLNGKSLPGNHFVAGVLSVFGTHWFPELFEVRQ